MIVWGFGLVAVLCIFKKGLWRSLMVGLFITIFFYQKRIFISIPNAKVLASFFLHKQNEKRPCFLFLLHHAIAGVPQEKAWPYFFIQLAHSSLKTQKVIRLHSSIPFRALVSFHCTALIFHSIAVCKPFTICSRPH